MPEYNQKNIIKNEAFIAKVSYTTEEIKRKIELDEPIFLTALLQVSDKKNANGRIYPHKVLAREIKKYQKLVEQKNALGELDHPNSRDIIEYKTASHRINKIWWEGNEVWGIVEILSGKHFPMANILRGCLLHNIPIGFSSRGMGSEIELDNDTVEVDDDFELICWDAVVQPSTYGAFAYLAESANKKRNDYELKMKKIDTLIYNILK